MAIGSSVNTPVILNYPNTGVIEVNNTSGAPVTTYLPGAPSTGDMVVVKDFGGNAGTYSITVQSPISGITIDGSATYMMNLNYQSITLYWNNIRWGII